MAECNSVSIKKITCTELLDAKTVAVILGISADSVNRLKKDSSFPRPFILGRSRRYKYEELMQWLGNQREK